jgi:glycosyltransferase involved in cell wall biosynthesis
VSLPFTVVIPTYERPGTLRRVLDALAAQRDAPEFEVVVVDDGSRDETPHLLETYRPSYPFRFFAQSNGGPAKARNRGVAKREGSGSSSSATTRCPRRSS